MQSRSSKISFMVLLALLVIAFGAIIKPFMLPAIFAVLVVVICRPVYGLCLRLCRGRRYLASVPAALFVTLCIFIPLGIVVGIIINNAGSVINYVMQQLAGGQVAHTLDTLNAWLAGKMNQFFGFVPSEFNLRNTIVSLLQSVSGIVYQYSPKVFAVTAGLLGGFILLVILVFVLFAEGERIYQSVISLIPLEPAHKKILASEVRGVITGTFLGQMATSVAQGILIGIGFWIAGINDPLIWGLVAVGVTMIPVIGGPLMYLPAVFALAASGSWGRGLFLFIYGVGIVSMIDNLIKPLVLRGRVKIHPILLALGIIGGCVWMGPAGIIVGPLVVVLMMAMLKIYQREFIG
jgi:predicted PurR-regulated permease PerM